MQAFLQSHQDITAEISIPDRVLYSDCVVIRSIGNQDNNVFNFRRNVVEICPKEIYEKLALFLLTQIVKLVYV
jgi:hypothetical protein